MPPRIRNPHRISSTLSSHISSSSPSSSILLSSTTSSSSLASSSHPFLPPPSSPSSCPCLRSFSSAPTPATKLRNDMFWWLNGPGAAFKHPLPGSTNYLSAYDRKGKLLRVEEKSDGPTPASAQGKNTVGGETEGQGRRSGREGDGGDNV